jgi:hypothetical protein
MAESYKRAKLITTSGTTAGTYTGFLNGATAQSVTIAGPFIYDNAGAKTSITISVAAGALVPVNCTSITPLSGSVLGLLA